MILILCLALVGYYIYKKYCETEQIKAVSKIDGITYEELSDLISKIKH